MRAVVYPPPAVDFPYLAVLFHSEGSVALSKPFATAEDAHRYIMDVASSLVTVESPSAVPA